MKSILRRSGISASPAVGPGTPFSVLRRRAPPFGRIPIRWDGDGDGDDARFLSSWFSLRVLGRGGLFGLVGDARLRGRLFSRLNA
ncbi:hypothetical protein NL676_031092 [Syzygium grande]|nr:hypothetical protein NL676_031092 [Syzygium grande]